jgi:hypothetical protein
MFLKIVKICAALVAHSYNSNYLVDRDQKNSSFEVAWENFQDPFLKISNTKKGR